MDRFSNSLRRLERAGAPPLRWARPRMTAAAAASNRATTSGGVGERPRERPRLLARGGVRAFTLPCRRLCTSLRLRTPQTAAAAAAHRVLPWECLRGLESGEDFAARKWTECRPHTNSQWQKEANGVATVEDETPFSEIQFVLMKCYILSVREKNVQPRTPLLASPGRKFCYCALTNLV